MKVPAAAKISQTTVAELVPYARNARQHSEEQIAKIAASIKRFGFNNPVLIGDGGIIIAGHGRVLAAQTLGLDKIPTVRLGHLSETERRAYVLADNRIALDATWNDELLALELADIDASGIELGLTGFSDDEIERLLAAATGESLAIEGEDDDAPEAPAEPVSRIGDLWIIGNHRALCGDATKREDVERLLDGAAPHLMVTDPPYGVSYDPDWRNHRNWTQGTRQRGRAIGQVTNDDRSDWGPAYLLFPGDVVYVWSPSGSGQIIFYHSLEAADFEVRNQIIWAKSQLVISRGHYHSQHENCWYAVRKGKTARWVGGRKQTTVWNIDKPLKSETGHSTQKPVECMRRPIVNNSKRGDAVYDPFLGSGTTLLAAESTGRIAIGLEIEPAYVDVICRRLEPFVGQPAILDGDGRTFAEIATARGVPLAA